MTKPESRPWRLMINILRKGNHDNAYLFQTIKTLSTISNTIDRVHSRKRSFCLQI